MKSILTLLTLLPFTSFCQSTPTPVSDQFSIGLTFSPDYCYRVLQPDALLHNTPLLQNASKHLC